MKYKKLKIAVAVAAPTAVVLICIFKEQIMSMSQHLGICMLYTLTGILCPGCGNTRSARAILNGDFLLAVRNNASLPFIALVTICFYIELAADIFGKNIKILPRKPWIWFVIAGLFIVYFIARNFIPAIAPV
ncbi:MAG: DUF2752 domain-containing protein [Ruminococcus sp.]|nr:DUF2752 domain-containing protein [Ruminococcus sp.]